MSLSKDQLDEIVNENYDRIFKYIMAKCGRKEDAEDLTQDTFLLLIKRSNKLSDDNISAWLYSVADKILKSYFRKKTADLSFLSDEDINNIPANDKIESEMGDEEFEKLLNDVQRKIYDALSVEEKIIFIERYVKKQPVSVITNILDVSPDTVYVQSYNIKKKAKKIISTTDYMLFVIKNMI